MVVRELGTIGYCEALGLQEELAAAVRDDRQPETLLLLEHPLVYTMGRSGSDSNILDSSIPVIRTNRGGDVTCHSPGQLVGYPIINLGRRGKDLRRHLRFLEELIIMTAADLGVESYRVEGKTGVWTDTGKLASIGVGVRHWVTMHGFALNVSNDLVVFNRINPCGISSCPIASLEMLAGRRIQVAEVAGLMAERFEPLLEKWEPVAA